MVSVGPDKFSCGDISLNGMHKIVSKHHISMVYCLCEYSHMIGQTLICTERFITDSA